MCILGHSTLIKGPCSCLGEMDLEQEVLPLTKCMFDISLHSLCYTFRNLQFVLFIADAGKTYDDILDWTSSPVEIIFIFLVKNMTMLYIFWIQGTRWRLNMIMSSNSFCYNCFQNLWFMYWRWWYACLAWVWHSRNNIFMKNQWCLGPNIGFTTKFPRMPKTYLV
jgi:hypothetical protein